MRIVFVTENGFCGGLDSFIVTLTAHWPDPSDQLFLLCNEDHPGLSVVRARGPHRLRVIGHRLPTARCWLDAVRAVPGGALLAKAFSPAVRYFVMILQWVGWWRLLTRLAPDRVMVINGGYPGGDSCRTAILAWAGLRNGRPAAVHNIHNLAVPPRWWERPMEAVVDHLGGRAAQVIVAVSAACAASLIQMRPRLARAPLQVIHNGIACNYGMTGGGLRRELGLDSEIPLGLMLGTYEPRKGHDFLLQSWRQVVRVLPRARLVIAGYGLPKQVAHVRTLVSRYGLDGNVTLFGFRDDVDRMIADADLLLVASQAFESFGLTLVEAMAREVAVVATTVGGVPEVVGEGDEAAGLLVSPDDPETYADEIVALLSDPERRHRFGRQGRRRFEARFTAERMAAAYAQLVRADNEHDVRMGLNR